MTYKIESHVKPPRIKKRKADLVPKLAQNAMTAYQNAFKRVYGVTPALEYNKQTKYVSDGKTSCSVKRLRELTTMLKARVDQ